MAEHSKKDMATKFSKHQVYCRYGESDWYKDIVYLLLYLQYPLELNRNECTSLKIKSNEVCFNRSGLVLEGSWRNIVEVFGEIRV